MFGYASWKRISKPQSPIRDSDGRKVLLLPAAATYGSSSPSAGHQVLPLVGTSFPRQGELGTCLVCQVVVEAAVKS